MTELYKRLKQKASNLDIIAASVSVDFSNYDIASLTPTSGIHLATVFTSAETKVTEGIAEAIKKGFVVDVDVESINVSSGEAGWEALEDFIDKASPESRKGSLVLCKFLRCWRSCLVCSRVT